MIGFWQVQKKQLQLLQDYVLSGDVILSHSHSSPYFLTLKFYPSLWPFSPSINVAAANDLLRTEHSWISEYLWGSAITTFYYEKKLL